MADAHFVAELKGGLALAIERNRVVAVERE